MYQKKYIFSTTGAYNYVFNLKFVLFKNAIVALAYIYRENEVKVVKYTHKHMPDSFFDLDLADTLHRQKMNEKAT